MIPLAPVSWRRTSPRRVDLNWLLNQEPPRTWLVRDLAGDDD